MLLPILVLVSTVAVLVSSAYLLPYLRRRLLGGGRGGEGGLFGFPGPVGYPLVGAMPLIDRRCPYRTFSGWRESYGDVVAFRMFHQLVVVVSGLSAIREVLITRGKVRSSLVRG